MAGTADNERAQISVDALGIVASETPTRFRLRLKRRGRGYSKGVREGNCAAAI